MIRGILPIAEMEIRLSKHVMRPVDSAKRAEFGFMVLLYITRFMLSLVAITLGCSWMSRLNLLILGWNVLGMPLPRNGNTCMTKNMDLFRGPRLTSPSQQLRYQRRPTLEQQTSR